MPPHCCALLDLLTLRQVTHFNETARTLLSVLHSRLARSGEPDAYNSVLPRSRTVTTLDALFGDDYEGVSAYAAWIYPREAVSTIAAWQRPGALKAYATHRLKFADKLAATDDDVNQHGLTRAANKSQIVAEARALLAASGAATAKDPRHREDRTTQGRRRSRRTAQATVPESLRPLFDYGYGSDDLPMTLEDIPLIDEQLAAELHVLHGVRELMSPARTYERGPSAASRLCSPVLADHSMILRSSDALVDVAGSARSGLTIDDLDEAHYRSAPNDGRLAAPLHLLSRSGFSFGARDAWSGDQRLRGRARRIVYSGARFGRENCFGPFMPYRRTASTSAFSLNDPTDPWAWDSDEEEFSIETTRPPFGSTQLGAQALGRLWERPREPDPVDEDGCDDEHQYRVYDSEDEDLVDSAELDGHANGADLTSSGSDDDESGPGQQYGASFLGALSLLLAEETPPLISTAGGSGSQVSDAELDATSSHSASDDASASATAVPLYSLSEGTDDHSSASAVSSGAEDDSSTSSSHDAWPNHEDLITLASQAAGSIPRRLMREALARGEVPEKRIDWVVMEALQVVVSRLRSSSRPVLTRYRCTPTSCMRRCTIGAPLGCGASPRRAFLSRHSVHPRATKSRRTVHMTA